MNDRRSDAMNASVPRTTIRGTGPRSLGASLGHASRTALTRALSDAADTGRFAPGTRIDHLKVRVPHNADARQIEAAIRAALRGPFGRRGG